MVGRKEIDGRGYEEDHDDCSIDDIMICDCIGTAATVYWIVLLPSFRPSSFGQRSVIPSWLPHSLWPITTTHHTTIQRMISQMTWRMGDGMGWGYLCLLTFLFLFSFLFSCTLNL